MAEALTNEQTPQVTADKGGFLGKYLVAAGALKQEQVQDLLDIQKIVKTRGNNTGLDVDRTQALNEKYGAVIQDSMLQEKPRYLGDLAVKAGMIQNNLGVDSQTATAVVENMAALQANHRMELIASTLSEKGVDKTALVKMRDRGIFPMDINNLPEEHWLEKAPEQVRRMQSETGMVKLLAGNLIQGSAEVAQSPDVQKAIQSTRKLAHANNVELTHKFNELGLPNVAAMVSGAQEQGIAQGTVVAPAPGEDSKTLAADVTRGVVDSSNKLQLELMRSIQRMNHNVNEWTLKRATNAGLDDVSVKALSDDQLSATRAMIEVATREARDNVKQNTGLEVSEMTFTQRFGTRDRGASRGGPAV